jgi:DNA-binding MarR family transcriptional regulator
MSAGALASALDCAANTATYHCNHLEKARLVVRERRGQSVWISRTPRGHELVDLMA